MEQRSDQRERSPTGGPGRRSLAVLALALFVVAAAVLMLVYLLPCGGEGPVPAIPDSGTPLTVADAAPPDLVMGTDLAPDRARPRGTRRITDRELRGLLRRHRGLIGACYHLAARRDPSMTPTRVSIKVTLGDRGRVRAVAVDAGGARRLSGCLRRAIRGWRFSRSLKAQTINFPILRPR